MNTLILDALPVAVAGYSLLVLLIGGGLLGALVILLIARTIDQ